MLKPRVSCFALPGFALWKRRKRASIARAEWILLRRLMYRIAAQPSHNLLARRAELMSALMSLERQMNIGFFACLEGNDNRLMDFQKNDPRLSDPAFQALLWEKDLMHRELVAVQTELYARHGSKAWHMGEDYSRKLEQEQENQSPRPGRSSSGAGLTLMLPFSNHAKHDEKADLR